MCQHVGHAHPRVVEAATRQMRVSNTNTRYLHDAILEYATALCETLPPSLSVCYFLNSASEANELALRMARAYTHRKDILVMEAAYHGHTTSLIDLSLTNITGRGKWPAKLGSYHPTTRCVSWQVQSR